MTTISHLLPYTFLPGAKAILSIMTETSTSIHLHTLPNGLTVAHEAMPWLASVSFTLLVPVGAVTDPQGQEGGAAVLSDWLYRGAGELDSKALSERLDGLGVRRGGGAGKESTTLSASLLASSFEPALRLYADVVRRPALTDTEFTGARTLAQQELASLGDSPSQQLFETLSKTYFASPHSNSAYGSEAGLAALSAQDLRTDYECRYAPAGAVLSVAGGVTWDEVKALAEELFGDWSGAGTQLPEVRVRPAHQDHLTQETSQVHIGVAFKSAAPGDEYWYEHALAVGVLSGGMSARLFSEVREKRGLVYSVAAVGRAVRGFGYTLSYAGTTTERAEETLEVLLHELRNLSAGVSAEELERARTGLLSKLVMQGESSGSRASALARDTFLLGEPRPVEALKSALEAVTLNGLNEYLAKHYAPAFTVLTLGAKPLAEVAQ